MKTKEPFRYEGNAFILELYPGNDCARLMLPGTEQCYFFYPGGDCHRMQAKDCTLSVGDWRISTSDSGVVSACRQETSRIWRKKEVHLELTPEAVELYYVLEGEGELDDVRYCRACYGDTELGFVGEFDEVFNTAPNFQERLYYHPYNHFTISNGTDLSLDVGCHALGSCVHCVGLHDRRDESFLVAGVAARPGEYTWDCFEWNPPCLMPPTPYEGDGLAGGGFAIQYAGKRQVDGSWTSPRLIFTVAENSHQVLPSFLEHCYAKGYLPRPEARENAPWWDEPIYCTWHDQMAAVAMAKRDHPDNCSAVAGDFMSEELVEEWLKALMDHDCKPGIVILDDRWQLSLNGGEPDPKKFPDMRRWIEQCHDRGMKVFLWTTVWNAEPLPPEECMTRDGKPVCGDITNPLFEKRFRNMIRVFFSDAPDCLNADGIKTDGLMCLPTGYGLKNQENLWGLELERRLLDILYDEAKRHKQDACVSTFNAHPYLAPCCDMVRIADMYTNRLTSHRTMLYRAEVYRQTLPYTLIDTDGQFSMYMLDDYAHELQEQAKIGIPSIYNAKLLCRDHVFMPKQFGELTEQDYRVMSETLHRYEAERKDRRRKS